MFYFCTCLFREPYSGTFLTPTLQSQSVRKVFPENDHVWLIKNAFMKATNEGVRV